METRYLRMSHCGQQGQEPKVCCQEPDSSCVTPENDQGQCININKCPAVVDLIDKYRPLPPEAVSYLKKLACNGAENYSVCCSGKDFIDMESNTANPLDERTTTLPPRKTGRCGVASSVSLEGRIFGGDTTQIAQYPWMALIECRHATGTTVYPCGASLIGKRYLVTAAHCVDSAGEIGKFCTSFRVRLGEHDIDNNGIDCQTVDGKVLCADKPVIILIEERIIHPQYKTGNASKNDIALVRLASDAPFTDHIYPICLPTEDIYKRPKKMAESFTVAGWGRTETGDRSNKMMHLNVSLVDLATCQTAYDTTNLNKKLWDKQICAGGEEGKDSCAGDSGGPLMRLSGVRYDLAGVISYGSGLCGLKGIPGVYTNIFAYRNWILNQMIP